MQRDWELIRKILTEAEKKQPGQMLMHSEIDGYDPLVVSAHIAMLDDSGYLKARMVRGTAIVLNATVLAITHKGYDLLDTMRSTSLWDRIKHMAKDKGIELTFEVVKTLGAVALEQTLGK